MGKKSCVQNALRHWDLQIKSPIRFSKPHDKHSSWVYVRSLHSAWPGVEPKVRYWDLIISFVWNKWCESRLKDSQTKLPPLFQRDYIVQFYWQTLGWPAETWVVEGRVEEISSLIGTGTERLTRGRETKRWSHAGSGSMSRVIRQCYKRKTSYNPIHRYFNYYYIELYTL